MVDVRRQRVRLGDAQIDRGKQCRRHPDLQGSPREVLGQWYETDPPEMSDVVPRQLAMLLHHCLTEVKTAFDAEAKEKATTMAREGVAAMRASVKRLRTG